MSPKTLLVFCDGTGKDGSLAPPRSAANGAQATVFELPGGGGGGGGDPNYATNILRLSRSVLPLDKKGNRQIVFYQSGVGSEADFAGEQVTGTGSIQAFGTAVASKIRDAYVFIAQNFEKGDEICIFGFSRGAYTARKLSGLIDAIGLLSRQNLSYFFEIWSQLVNKKPVQKFPDTQFPEIK
ncbi:hypothetical protein L218DRAFT_1005643 [Marasmius fiardii PR-910]|nr:hypothetical protein L218DRAFT_1005643 [Marasmius fiardii PR-910]